MFLLLFSTLVCGTGYVMPAKRRDVMDMPRREFATLDKKHFHTEEKHCQFW